MLTQVQFALQTLLAVSWTRVIVWGVEVAQTVYPNTHISWIVMGTLAGAGGGMLENVEREIWQDNPKWDFTCVRAHPHAYVLRIHMCNTH